MVLHWNISGEAISISLGNAKLIPSDMGKEIIPPVWREYSHQTGGQILLAKNILQNFYIQSPQFPQRLPTFHFLLSRSHCFPVNAVTVLIEVL
jgi:hypothetical protein